MITEHELSQTLEEAARARIVAWFTDYLAELLALDPAEVDIEMTFNQYGLDSSAAVGMTGDLAKWLRYNVDPAAVYDCPSISKMATFLAADPLVQGALREAV